MKYGLRWNDQTRPLHVELICFANGGAQGVAAQIAKGRDYSMVEDTTKQYHFKQIVRQLWGHKSRLHFQFNPWNERMLDAVCENKYVGLAGAASSGKSTFMAMWGIVNWFSDPVNTIVLFTSTSLKDSKRRIWAKVEDFFSAAVDAKGHSLLPGKLVSSQGVIRTEGDGQKFSELCGLHLIPGDKAKEKQNIGKIIGIHTKRVFLMADELPELSPALANAAKSNLATAPVFQMVGSGNFASVYDPFGEFCEPTNGWGSVDAEHDEWQTKDGICLRFDGFKSPNVLLGREEYVGLFKATDLAEIRSTYPENSPEFWRMVRSFPCPEADTNRIYSEADMLKGDVKSTVVKWKSDPTKWSSLDPAWANGGDDAIATYGLCGMSIENKMVMLVTKQEAIYSNVKEKVDNRATQVAKEWMRVCRNEGIKSQHMAYDATGGGIVFGSLMQELWRAVTTKIGAPEDFKGLGVQFGGAPSDRPTSIKKDGKPVAACDAYTNRVAELWYSGVEFVLSGQIKGLPGQCCVELKERRRKDPEKSGAILKRKIESKKEMKARTKNISPDRADSALVGCELCRERLNFTVFGMEGSHANVGRDKKDRKRIVNRLYAGNTHENAFADAA